MSIEVQITEKELKELEEHTPIKRSKVTAITAMIGLYVFLCKVLLELSGLLNPDAYTAKFLSPALDRLIVILFFSILAYAAAGFMWYRITGSRIKKSLGNYYWRNIKGYTVWYYYFRDILHVTIKPRGILLTDEENSTLISVPLGGWGNRKGNVYFPSTIGKRLGSWCWTRRSYAHIGYVMLTDQYCSLLLTPERALELLHSDAYSLSSEVLNLLATVQLLELKHGVLTSQKVQLQTDYAFSLHETIDALDATKRFIKSEEAGKIRESLAARLEKFKLSARRDEDALAALDVVYPGFERWKKKNPFRQMPC